MTWERIAVVVAAIALMIAGLYILAGGPAPQPSDHRLPDHVPQYDWQVQATNPALFGNASDRFVYSGGTAIQTASGTARVAWSISAETGSIEISVDELAGIATLGSESLAGRIELTATLGPSDTLWQNAFVNGDTGRGDARLPRTRAFLAGSASFRILYNGRALESVYPAEWIIGDAVRRADGSIRQDGLVFTPLLRDKTGFSDASRTELTVLLYDPSSEGKERPVMLDLVFRDVVFDRVPDTVTVP